MDEVQGIGFTEGEREIECEREGTREIERARAREREREVLSHPTAQSAYIKYSIILYSATR